jgi:aspartate/methionine/tyrosine aminotransferase
MHPDHLRRIVALAERKKIMIIADEVRSRSRLLEH